MDKVGVLYDKDGDMMHEFSRRSLDRLAAGSRLFMSLPFMSAYLDANVKKEVAKDRLIIEEAAEAFKAGKDACDLDLEDIFEKTKKVDQAFLNNLMIPTFSFSIRYSDFADIRIKRIWRISKTVYALLGKWPDTAAFADVVRNVYTEQSFKELIREILHLYNLETRMLIRSMGLLSPFSKAMTSRAETLFQAMEDAAEDMAHTYTNKIFGNKNVYV